MKERKKKKVSTLITALMVTVVFLVVFGFCSTKTETKEQKTWKQETEEKLLERVGGDIKYFYDARVDLCYAVVYYHSGYSKAIGLTVVPYEKVKDYAITINESPSNQKASQ